jgi:hypothetical protein
MMLLLWARLLLLAGLAAVVACYVWAEFKNQD